MAEALHGWLRRVIQSARPFHSDKDIESGAFWDEAIRANLKNARFAIVCCTPENVTAPWLNYEAGALAERLEGRTAPLLLGAKPAALGVSPVSRLHAQEADRVGVLHVIRSLNANLLQPLEEGLLADEFADKWPRLEEKLRGIPAPTVKVDERSERDMLEEVVGLGRQLSSTSQNGRLEYALQSIARVEGMLERALGLAYPGPNIASGSQVFEPSFAIPLGVQGAQGPQGAFNPSSNFHLGMTGAQAPTFLAEVRNRVHQLLAERGYAAMPPPDLLAAVTAEISSKRLTPSAEFDAVVIRIAEQRGLIPKRG
jgi:hypothetical protein